MLPKASDRQSKLTMNSNTAQVLTSLAEANTGGRKPPEKDQNYALSLLQEALELFQRCLNLQEFKYNQAQEDVVNATEPLADNGDLDQNSSNSAASNASEEEVWASVEEPITKHTLLDTAVAQLDTLTATCGLGGSRSHNNLAWIEEYYRTELQAKIKFYVGDVGDISHQYDAALAKAKFSGAIADAAFRSGHLDLLTYEQEINAAFTAPELHLEHDPQGLWDRADVELTFRSSIQASIANAQLVELPQVANICWKHITKALDSLTTASKLPDALNLPRIHLRRGDCEMLRLCLGEAPLHYDLAIKSKPTLLKNAGVYYRGAGALAKRDKGDEEEQRDAEIKEAVAAALSDDAQRLAALIKLQRGLVEATVEEMRDENLLGDESLRKIGTIFA